MIVDLSKAEQAIGYKFMLLKMQFSTTMSE